MTEASLHQEIEEYEARILTVERSNAELSRFVEELNTVVIEQDKRLMKLERQIQELVKQSRQSGSEAGQALPQERPPHY